MNAFEQLIEHIQKGNLAEVRRLVDEDPNLLRQRTPAGLSPLMVALYYGQNDLEKWIVDQGFPLDIYEAAGSGKSLRALELLKQDPSLANSHSPDGFTPLALAAFFGRQTVADILLARGADPSLPSANPTRVQPLHSAVASRHLAIAEVLLKAGADPNARQQNGFTPLHGAAQNGQAGMVRLLLRYGADPALLTEDGKSALDFASEGGYTNLEPLLIRKG